jgi:ferric-dicitrate binding protein FerR (iron transport regulator)
MMQHLRITNTGAGNQAETQSRAGWAPLRPAAMALLGLLWMGLGTGRAPAQNPAQPPAANVARVSFVQGSVQLTSGQGADFQQAVMNMPVLDGSRLQTGADGQAEIEFGDGSVARLTPNSTLQFDHLGQDQVQLEQLSGLAYYEFNVGDGHPAFGVQFSNRNVQPTANAILRLGLDTGWEVAVISGTVKVQGAGIPPVDVAENQSIHSSADNGGAPYAVAQGITGDSWDNWNQDRDQAIAQEAAQQTPVRDGSANPGDENWNDLDANGNWYPVEGSGNVWVPSGVGPGWDPYGSGYWGYYPTLGYTWISGYPWGWLPYHCGNWNYYGFGWGWAPGGCGRVWSPVIGVRNYPAGWIMPVRPLFRGGGGLYPLPAQRLLAVDRGPLARGPWANGAVPMVNHQQALNLNGRTVAPIARVDVRSEGFAAARGTAPGTRAVLSGAPRPGSNSFTSGVNPPRAVGRPNVGYAPAPSSNQRSTYVARPMASPHSSAPPPPHNSAPPPHASSSNSHR